MRCGGARETLEPRVTIGWLLPVSDILSNLPAFQDSNGTFLKELYGARMTHCRKTADRATVEQFSPGGPGGSIGGK